MTRPAHLLASLLACASLAACAGNPGGSYVAPLTAPADAQTLAVGIADFMASSLPAAATTLALEPPSPGQSGNALTPVLACFDDPAVVGAGWRGVAVQDGWREFADAGPGEVEALLGYLFAVRRSAALATPLPPKARFYRNADMEWSFLLREAGGRLLVPAGDLPVRQDRHRGYHDSDPAVRDRESKRTYDRFLQRFRGREDLRLPVQDPAR